MLGIVEHHAHGAVGQGQPGRQGFGGGAHPGENRQGLGAGVLDLSLLAQPVDFLQRTPRDQQSLARAHDHPAAVGVDLHHEQRIAHRHVQPPTLSDGIAGDPFVAAQHPAVQMDDVPRLGALRAQAIDHGGVSPLGDEADVLAVGLLGDGQTQFGRRAADLALGQVTEREAQIVQLLGRGGEQEIALVARRIGGAAQLRPGRAHLAADIVAGGHRLRAQVAGDIQQVAELHGLIAADAGDRRLAAQIGVGELLDHLFLEAAFIVEDVVRDADGVSRGAGVVDILARAAGALLLDRGAMVVELQGHADHIIAGAGQESGGHRGVHAAGHGRHDARAHRQPDGVAGGLDGMIGEESRRVHRAYVAGHAPICEIAANSQISGQASNNRETVISPAGRVV